MNRGKGGSDNGCAGTVDKVQHASSSACVCRCTEIFLHLRAPFLELVKNDDESMLTITVNLPKALLTL